MNRLEDIIPVEAQEMLIAAGFHMERPALRLEDNHDLLDIELELKALGNAMFNEQLTSYTYNGKVKFKVAGTPVKLKIDGKRIKPVLDGIYLTGPKKGIVLKRVLDHSVNVDLTEDETWITHTVVFNGKPYRIGKMKEADAWFMTKVTIPEHTPGDYARLWRQRTAKHEYTALGQIELVSDQYGEAEVGLGSIVTDQIEAEMEEAVATILKYKDTYAGRQVYDYMLYRLGLEEGE